MSGTPGKDTLFGTFFGDDISGLGGDDTITGLAGNDILHGDDGNDTLFGGSTQDGNVFLDGFFDHDYLNGGMGDDTLYGGVGNDILVGEAGHDTLKGGAGNDTFEFHLFSDSPNFLPPDVITDFTSGGDKIDLTKLDADPGTANFEPFSNVVSGPPTTPGEVGFQPGLVHALSLNGVDHLFISLSTTGIAAPVAPSDILT